MFPIFDARMAGASRFFGCGSSDGLCVCVCVCVCMCVCVRMLMWVAVEDGGGDDGGVCVCVCTCTSMRMWVAVKSCGGGGKSSHILFC